jgi:carotenoid cleavage dioxygenase
MRNRYLEGNYAPVHEEVTVADLPITGSIPDHLDGRYLRTGPNPVTEADPSTYHWFLGTGMVHGLRIRDGRAEWYRNRFVRSADVSAALAEEPHPGPVHAAFDFAANTNVIGHGGRTFAIVEAGPRPYELTDELETIGPCDFDGTLPGGYSAHPHRDPATGELHTVSYFWAWGNKVKYTVLGTDGLIRRAVDVEVGASPMMHDFSLTEHYVVIYDLPVTFNLELASASLPPPVMAVASRLAGRSAPEAVAKWVNRRVGTSAFPYRWDPEYQARIGVLSREGGPADVRWFDVEPCYVFHPLNAYEEGDNIVLDVVRHPKMFDTDLLGPNEGEPTLDRWTVDLRAGKVIEARLDDRGQEFPRIDERILGRRHRYGYTVATATTTTRGEGFGDCVLKHDLHEGDTAVRSFDGGQASEFVFVPAAPDAAEDQGVLMGFVYSPGTDRSDLVMLDAGTLDTVASVHLPVRVPHGFHGNWIAT